jgi:hypothetical protein
MPISAGGRMVMGGVSSKLGFQGSRNRGQIATGPARKGDGHQIAGFAW